MVKFPNKDSRPSGLKSVMVGSLRLIHYSSFLDVLNVPATDDDPLTITVSEAARKSGLSTKTIQRMMARGKASEAAE